MTCSEAGAARRLLASGLRLVVMRLVVMVVMLVGLAGCIRPPLLVPVKGVVLLDGKPLSSGVVQFQPAAGQLASGVIAGDGTFTLSRHLPNDGIPPGTYRVAVTAFDPLAEVQSVENLIVPVKYTRFGSSGIEFTVFPGTLEPLVVSLSSESDGPRPATGPETVTGVSASESSKTPASNAPASNTPALNNPGGDARGTPDTTLGGA
ncbi:MAG: hypothetical protein KGR24_09850 [Planctomycetes bacterium]|nr:hypothetical protein [Planctomycetota bacterium]